LDAQPVVSDGVLTSIPVISGGLGYSNTDLVNIFDLQNEAYAGYGAKAVPIVDVNGSILSLNIISSGRNYDPKYLRVFVIGDGNGFEANTTGATVENGVITEIKIRDTGSGYDSGFPLSVVPGTEGSGTGFDAEILTQDIRDGALSVTLTSPGSGYTGSPKVILKGGKLLNYDYPLTFVEGSRVILQAEVQDQDGFVEEVKFFGNGELLGSAPLGNLTGITLLNPGAGFAAAPTITIIYLLR
jgi:hypothetical protein